MVPICDLWEVVHKEAEVTNAPYAQGDQELGCCGRYVLTLAHHEGLRAGALDRFFSSGLFAKQLHVQPPARWLCVSPSLVII